MCGCAFGEVVGYETSSVGLDSSWGTGYHFDVRWSWLSRAYGKLNFWLGNA